MKRVGACYGGMDLNAAARRKNATRETTSTLKAWLYEHKKNPYPTKGEKIMLAIITKMTLTQVSTWFANARRRLKKENKMTWEPRNRVDDEDDAKSENGSGATSGPGVTTTNIGSNDDDDLNGSDVTKRRNGTVSISDDDADPDHGDRHCDLTRDSLSMASDSPQPSPPPPLSSPSIQPSPSPPDSTRNRPSTDTTPASISKPRIWSLAHTATCTSPPTGRRPISPTGSMSGQSPSVGSTTNAMAAMAAERRLALVNARTWMTASAALGTLGLASQYHSLVNGPSRGTADCPNSSARSSGDAHQISYSHQQSLLNSGVVKSNLCSIPGDRTGIHTSRTCMSQVDLFGTAFRPVPKSNP